jgi:agmatinase
MSFQTDSAFTRENDKGIIQEHTFAGALSFMRRRYTRDLANFELAVTGIPFDCATTNRPGTRFGPRAIREQSSLQAHDAPYGWSIDPFGEIAIADFGDCAFDHARVDQIPTAIRDHTTAILDTNTAVLTLGGDHYISYPVIAAHAQKYGPLSLIQFDAHSDTWADDEADRIDHGTMFYKAFREGLVVPERSVQVGIRTSNPDTLGVNIIDAMTVHQTPLTEIAAQIRGIVGDNPVYLTFDIDSLDPAYAPGTGTPVSGGLTSAQVAILLRQLVGINLIGMDVVEVAPAYDHSGITAIAAAHVAVDLICLWAASPGRTSP